MQNLSINSKLQEAITLVNSRSEVRLTEDELQYLLLLEFHNQQTRQKQYYAFYLASPVPIVTGGKVLGMVAFAALGFFLAPVLGIGALTGVLLGASIGWRLFGGGNKGKQNSKNKQDRITSSPGFDSAPQPPTIGSPIPLIVTNTYTNPSGGVRIVGNIINSRVRTERNKQNLFCLIALGLGEIGEIDNNLLLVDNQSLTNFYSGVIKSSYTTGYDNQSRFEEYDCYSQVISPSGNATIGASFRANVSGLAFNTFNVPEDDYDSFVPTEYYRLGNQEFRIANKFISGSNYRIVADKNLNTFDGKVYSIYRFKYRTQQKCTRIELNFAFDISARKESDNKLTSFAIVFDVYVDGQQVGRFYEVNKKEGTIRRAITIDNLFYGKHTIETYSHPKIFDTIQPIRIDDSGIIRTINTGLLSQGKSISLILESNPNNQHSISAINGFLDTSNKAQTSADRGANGKISTVNEIAYPSDLGHSAMTNYRQLVLNNIVAEASDNLSSSPAYSSLVKKGLVYRNHLAAGDAGVNSNTNILFAYTDLAEVLTGHICRNISRSTESVITAVSGNQITTEFSLNWKPGEKYIIFFNDSINRFPDFYVYTRLSKSGVKGNKITEKFIDYPSICNSRAFCRNNGFFYDAVVDQPTKWNEFVMKESLASLLFPFKFAGNYGLLPEQSTNPTDIFNVARILPGSFTQSSPAPTSTNCVQLTYKALDSFADADYVKRDITITVMTADAYYGREDLEIDSLGYESITNENQAKKVAARYLKSKILQDKVLKFKTSIAGFKCREGEIIIVQYSLTELEKEISGFCVTAGNLSSGSQEIKLSKTPKEDYTNQGMTASIYHLETGNIQVSKPFIVLPSGNLIISGLTEQIKPIRENFNGDVIIINKNITDKYYRISSVKPSNYEVEITAVNWTNEINNDSDLFYIL